MATDSTPALILTDWNETSDEDVVKRVLAGQASLYEILIRRYNQRLYRLARSTLRNDGEEEDVMQEAYVRAYEHLNQFAGEAKFSTWLAKIAVYEALGRLRRRGRTEELDVLMDSNKPAMAGVTSDTRDPERQAYDRELRVVLEHAIDSLPAIYRLVFVLRSVEGLSVAETATTLDIGPEAACCGESERKGVETRRRLLLSPSKPSELPSSQRGTVDRRPGASQGLNERLRHKGASQQYGFPGCQRAQGFPNLANGMDAAFQHGIRIYFFHYPASH